VTADRPRAAGLLRRNLAHGRLRLSCRRRAGARRGRRGAKGTLR
jgi:hypothetical protein